MDERRVLAKLREIELQNLTLQFKQTLPFPGLLGWIDT
jgi:hypothetical protein